IHMPDVRASRTTARAASDTAGNSSSDTCIALLGNEIRKAVIAWVFRASHASMAKNVRAPMRDLSFAWFPECINQKGGAQQHLHAAIEFGPGLSDMLHDPKVVHHEIDRIDHEVQAAAHDQDSDGRHEVIPFPRVGPKI